MKVDALKETVPIGSMDERITLKAPSSSKTASGSEEVTYPDDTAVIWAHIKFRSGNEKEEENKITFIQTVVFSFYYYTGLNQEFVIEWEGVTYDIINVHHIGRRRYHIVEGVARQ